MNQSFTEIGSMPANRQKFVIIISRSKDIVTDKKADKEVTNNNVFIGSTAELQKLLQQAEADEKIIEHGEE